MFVHDSRHLRFNAVQAWWPQGVAEVLPFLNQAPVVILWQCPAALAPEFRPWVFQQRPFHTPLIDLRQAEEALWQKLEPKSCRYEIRKAQKMDCVLSCNEETEAGRLLINDSIRRLRYRAELSEKQWHYDFGGCDLDKESETYPVTQFKLSFGGQVVEEPILYLARNPALRAILRGQGAARRALRRIPWPESWLKAARTMPKLGSWFR